MEPRDRTMVEEAQRILVNLAAPLFDDLIRLQQQCLWDREPEDLRGLHVDNQLILRRLLNRQVAGLGAFEDLVHEVRGAMCKSGEMDPHTREVLPPQCIREEY